MREKERKGMRKREKSEFLYFTFPYFLRYRSANLFSADSLL
uniref:Uncharacterized protein n=1 Tax=Octopus bimaculoides TaxID=37653 RepID=A0A0L8FHR4_OCTBM